MLPGKRVLILGATGAVGSRVASGLAGLPDVDALTLLGRRRLEGISGEHVQQHEIDVFDPASYVTHLPGHESAICTLGVGQPSKVSRDDFVRLDKGAVLDFAAACKNADVQHFQLLGSVGANPRSRSFYLRTKGELEAGLKALDFERLSLFQPSMILTPTNRYGVMQALTLAVWPKIGPLMVGPLRKYRGVPVQRLSDAMAANLWRPGSGVETLLWDEIEVLSARGDAPASA